MSLDANNKDALEIAYSSLRQRLDELGKKYEIDFADVQDSLQDGYLRLANKNIKCENEAKGKLYVTVRNLIIDRLRRKSTNRIVRLDEVDDVDSVPNWDESEKAEDLMEKMRSAISSQQLGIMKMLSVDGLDYKEIAKELNMTEGAVRTCVSRARKKLIEKMK